MWLVHEKPSIHASGIKSPRICRSVPTSFAPPRPFMMLADEGASIYDVHRNCRCGNSHVETRIAKIFYPLGPSPSLSVKSTYCLTANLVYLWTPPSPLCGRPIWKPLSRRVRKAGPRHSPSVRPYFGVVGPVAAS